MKFSRGILHDRKKQLENWLFPEVKLQATSITIPSLFNSPEQELDWVNMQLEQPILEDAQ